MFKRSFIISTVLGLGLLSASCANAMVEDSHIMQLTQDSTAFKTESGLEAGTVKMTEGPNGVLFHIELENIAPGTHGLHLHDIGDCTPYGALEDEKSAFTRAGGHLNPKGVEHGFLNEKGLHAGDLPNIHVPENGELKIDVFGPGLSLNHNDDMISLKDDDGSALMIHAGADDYTSPKTGHAGSRMACAEIK